MKNVLFCLDSFKGTLSTFDIISISKEVIDSKYKSYFNGVYLPIADGGEGSLDIILAILEGKTIYVDSIDAEYNAINVPYFISKDNDVYIEVAKIIGLPYLTNKIPSLERTTKGIGIVILDALRHNPRSINIFLGGSSTNEMGIGLLSYLGVDFNVKGELTAKNIKDVYSFNIEKLKEKIKGIKFNCYCDVTNPLTGINGASYIFGKQKGYNEKEIEFLDKSFIHFSSIIKKELGKDLTNIPSLGASGGLGGCFYSFFDASIKLGIDKILDLSDFDKYASKADLIITGEGSFDSQSLNGKAINGILKRVDKNKLVIICGKSKISDPLYRIYRTSDENMPFEYIKEHAKDLYRKTLIKVLDDFI